jgi:hypothetical protein
MADSEKEPKPLPASLPEGVTALVVANQHGALHEVLKDGKSGKFLAKKKPLIPTIEFTRKERKILDARREQGDKKGMSEHEIAFRNILRISQIDTTDAKEMMAVVKAYEVVMRRALGKEATSEQDLDRMEKQAITGYFIQAPALPNPTVEDGDKPKDKPTQPSFAEVIGVVTNEKK